MADSRIPCALGARLTLWTAARTPGALGFRDQSDPNLCTLLGDTPGPLGLRDHADPTLGVFATNGPQGGLMCLPDGTVLSLPAQAIPGSFERAPWMQFAENEARRFKGATEATIEQDINYATAVNTGQDTMVGSKHPWCAAFVNWCLQKAGFQIENLAFTDRVAAKGRAHGFFEVKGLRVEKGAKDVPLIRNPLFVKLDAPVFGAIAMVTNRSGHGHHVGFVYSQPRDNFVVLLGGNQNDRIKFSEFNIRATKPTTVERHGKKTTIPGHPDHLMFLVPASYESYALADKQALGTQTAEALNQEFGIVAAKSTARESTR